MQFDFAMHILCSEPKNEWDQNVLLNEFSVTKIETARVFSFRNYPHYCTMQTKLTSHKLDLMHDASIHENLPLRANQSVRISVASKQHGQICDQVSSVFIYLYLNSSDFVSKLSNDSTV